jgi:predicted Zn-dependent peptidase
MKDSQFYFHKCAAKSFNLKNNVKVVLSETFGIDVVAIRVLTSVSVVNETLSNAGVSYLTVRLMTQSTKNRSNEILSKEIENIGGDLGCSVDYDMSGVSMLFLSKYFNEAAEILADVILNPLFDEKELFFEKQNVLAVFNLRKDSMERTALDEFTKIFYQDAPYSVPVYGTRESVLKINCDDLIKWHKYSYNTYNTLISVAGNLTEKFVRESLEKYFSSIPKNLEFRKSFFYVVERFKPIVKTIKGKFNQTYMLVGFPAPSVSCDNFILVELMNAILGGSRMTSRLFIELREKLGFAYEVGSMYPLRREKSYLAIYVGFDKENMNLVLKKIAEILKDFCTTEVSDEELTNTKMYVKGLYVMDRQTVSKVSYHCGWCEIVGLGYDYGDKHLEDLEKVTTKNIFDVSNKMFSSPFSIVTLSSCV